MREVMRGTEARRLMAVSDIKTHVGRVERIGPWGEVTLRKTGSHQSMFK